MRNASPATVTRVTASQRPHKDFVVKFVPLLRMILITLALAAKTLSGIRSLYPMLTYKKL